MNITMIDLGYCWADSFAGDVRAVPYKGRWALAVRCAGGAWQYSKPIGKRTALDLAERALPYVYAI